MVIHNNSNSLHLIYINSQGLRNQNKRLRLNEWLIQQKTDIALLQETHFTADIEYNVKNDFKTFYIYHSYGSNLSKGCSILVKDTLNINIIDFHKDQIGRFALLNIEIDKYTYSVLKIVIVQMIQQ